jgi:hypothetical protein
MRLSVISILVAFAAGTPPPASATAWTLGFSTYFGGSDMTTATAVAVDGSGNIYVAGWTDSTTLPGCTPVRPNAGGVDAFVVKWDGATHHIDYCTFLGGRGDDRAFAIAVDNAGFAYITGRTMSVNFPLSGALQTVLAGSENAFVAKLNPQGGLVYSGYLGGSGSDSGNAIAVDGSGRVTVVGDTTSANFPLLNPIQSSLNGQTNVFITRLSPAGNSLVYSTYLGGNGNDHGAGVALDSTGAAYLTGSTTSTNFPVVSAFQPKSGGNQDAFVAKIASSGNTLVYSTYLGGTGGTVGFPETGSAIAVDSAGDAYVAGITSSPNFPLTNALFSNSAGVGIHAFVTELNAAGNGLVYSTYLGGSSVDEAAAIAVDSGGNAVVAGFTASPDFPLANPTQASLAGSYDAFVTRLNSTGTALLESTVFGGSGSDAANAVAYSAAGAVCIAGQTQSFNLPIQNATQPVLAGAQNAFLAMFTLSTQASAPTAPTGLTATAGDSSAALNWTASAGATSYNVYRGTTAGGESATAVATGIATTSYRDTGLNNLTKYYYEVAAVDSGGTSALSAEASATPDVNGDFDGNGHPDLIWQNSNGTAVLWYMGGADGSTNLSSTYISGAEPGWQIVAVADLDGNGIPDLIWQNTNGSVVVWYMGGAGGSTYQTAKYLAGPVSGWRVAAVADLDGNGHPDLIWQYTDGSVVVWYMGGADGSTNLSSKYLSGAMPGWLVKGAADLDDNGHPDLIWQYTDGSVMVWYMGGTDGSTNLSSKSLAGVTPGWLVVAAADLPGNGHPDLIWQNTNGSVVVWYMGGTDGSTYLSSKYLAGPTSGWLVPSM